MLYTIEILRFHGPDGAGPWWDPHFRLERETAAEVVEEFARRQGGLTILWWMRPAIFDLGHARYRVTGKAVASE
jgi:hypothetical protein